jgi:hypothetical protein
MFGHPQEMVSRPNIARRRQFFEKTAWQIEKAFVLAHSRRDQAVFPGSSAVEHSTVNRQVAGSNPARGASFFSIELIIAKRRTSVVRLFFFAGFRISPVTQPSDIGRESLRGRSRCLESFGAGD